MYEGSGTVNIKKQRFAVVKSTDIVLFLCKSVIRLRVAHYHNYNIITKLYSIYNHTKYYSCS